MSSATCPLRFNIPYGPESLLAAMEAWSDIGDFQFDCRTKRRHRGGIEFWCRNRKKLSCQLRVLAIPTTDGSFHLDPSQCYLSHSGGCSEQIDKKTRVVDSVNVWCIPSFVSLPGAARSCRTSPITPDPQHPPADDSIELQTHSESQTTPLLPQFESPHLAIITTPKNHPEWPRSCPMARLGLRIAFLISPFLSISPKPLRSSD